MDEFEMDPQPRMLVHAFPEKDEKGMDVDGEH
jgi:hypothetical protein